MGHHIPISRAELFVRLSRHPGLRDEQRTRLAGFLQQLNAVLHFEYHDELERLKALYRGLDPDAQPGVSGAAADREALWEELAGVLRDANYAPVSADELAASFASEGLVPVSLDVPFDDFAFYRIHALGSARASAEVPGLLPWTKRRVELELYERVVLAFQPKPAEHFAGRRAADIPGTPGKLYLKLLQRVPKADLEMLFPNSKPRMKLIHKLKVFLPLVTGLGITLHKLVLAPYVLGTGRDPLEDGLSLGLVAILGGLAGYVFKAWSGYRSTLQDFLAKITKNLYFRNLVSNGGVFANLIDTAEEEEAKEAVLAFTFLLTEPDLTSEAALDAAVEAWLEKECGRAVDFESADALAGLRDLGLLAEGKELRPLSLREAQKVLDTRWDAYFSP